MRRIKGVISMKFVLSGKHSCETIHSITLLLGKNTKLAEEQTEKLNKVCKVVQQIFVENKND